jgi:hypothetical protein
MDSSEKTLPIAPEIRAVLAGVRWRIRAYVVMEGIATAMIWLAGAFWLTLAIDYLPILVGANELPQGVRGFLLLITLGGFAFLGYWFVVRRLLVQLSDRSMAILLERRYREFGDGLLTAVEMTSSQSGTVAFNEVLLQRTKESALERISGVNLERLFNFRPLAWRWVCAMGLVASLIGFAAWNSPAFSHAAHRLWLLGNEPWPRRSRIEVVGIEVQRPEGLAADSDLPSLLTFEQGTVKVARGASFNLRVLADASAAVVPEYCSIRYWTEEGDFGVVRMKKIGRVRSEEVGDGKRSVQWYTFDGKPFKGILSSVTFDVMGNDHRVGSYAVKVVDSPLVVDAELDCVYPEYLTDEATSSWLPSTKKYLPSGTQLARGTRVLVRCQSNKELQRVVVRNLDTLEETRIDITEKGDAARRFEYPIPQLDSNLSLEVQLFDRDQVYGDKPFRLALAAITDEAPRIETRLSGIGSAVTPDVVVPARGKITDDYRVGKTWIEVQIGENDPRQRPFLLGREGEIETELDFRELRSDAQPLEIKPQDKLRLRVSASDLFKLGEEGPNVGAGELYELDVVPPEELLRLLESRELGLRRRFEQIIEEMTELRDSMLRVKVELNSPGSSGEVKPNPMGDVAEQKPENASSGGEAASEGVDDGLTPAQRAQSLRLLRVQRAIQQSQKSSQEVLGVALSFAEIREELINNRVDTEDRKERLQEQIAAPLQRVVAERFPELERRLNDLEQRIAGGSVQDAAASSSQVHEQAELTLLELDDVLQKMLDLETYNELLDIVRDLIKEQSELLERTRQQQKKQLRDLTE